MRFWVFSADMLMSALAAREAMRQGEGATEQQAKDETQAIVAFLTGDEARAHKMFGEDGRG